MVGSVRSLGFDRENEIQDLGSGYLSLVCQALPVGEISFDGGKFLSQARKISLHWKSWLLCRK